MGSHMRQFLYVLFAILLLAGIDHVGRSANVETVVAGSAGVCTSQGADGRTWTVTACPHTNQSGTTYTLANTDCGTVVNFTSGTAVTVTIPATLNLDCSVNILQTGAGQVSMTGTAVTAATLHSSHSFTKTAGQYAMITIFIYQNSGGSSAIADLLGDGA